MHQIYATQAASNHPRSVVWSLAINFGSNFEESLNQSIWVSPEDPWICAMALSVLNEPLFMAGRRSCLMQLRLIQDI